MDWGTLFANVAPTVAQVGLGMYGANKAAKATKQGNAAASAIQQQQYEQSRADLGPWRQAGNNALSWLSKINTPGGMPPGAVEGFVRNLPGYDFASSELNRALTAKQAAAGNRFSGAAIKAGAKYNNDYLVQPFFNQWTNSLSDLSRQGAGAAGSIAGYGANNANAQAGYATGNADASGGAAIANANLFGNGLQNISNTYRQQPMMDAYSKYLSSIAGRSSSGSSGSGGWWDPAYGSPQYG